MASPNSTRFRTVMENGTAKTSTPEALRPMISQRKVWVSAVESAARMASVFVSGRGTKQIKWPAVSSASVMPVVRINGGMVSWS